jgi:cystathionine beta-lyase/cystathionine gamma-synthase
MTHIGMDAELKERIGITEGLIRLSVGVENSSDLIDDISEALDLARKSSLTQLEAERVN